MDYRHTSIDTLTEFAEEFPQMTLGDILYSFLREGILGKKIESITDIRSLGDREIYIAIDKAKKYETE